MVKIIVIILAAGYATRLHPLTKDKPKSLLPIAKKPIVEHILEKLEPIGDIKKIYIVSNNKFFDVFQEWLSGINYVHPIEIVNNGTNSNEERLGAVGDLAFCIQQKSIHDDIMVIAGDNLFEEPLLEHVNNFKKHKHNALVLYDVKDEVLCRHFGVVELQNNIITHFEEKPEHPRSTLVSTGIYFFPQKTIELLSKYIEQGNNPDKSGDFVAWLYKREPVYGIVSRRMWYDIGTFEQLEEANRNYRQ